MLIEKPIDAPQFNSNIEHFNPTKTKLFNNLLLSFIITSFSAFEIVENFHFQRLIYTLNPKYRIPCAKTVANLLLDQRYIEVITNIKNELSKVDCICATTDNWTSVQDYGYIGVTIHFIDDSFTLQSYTIATKHIQGSHCAAILTNTLFEIFQKWQIVEKVFYKFLILYFLKY